jgi:hypothetical protein
VITEAKAARAEKARVARETRPSSPAPSTGRKEARKNDGPGLYITNQHLGNHRAAELGPYDNMNLAEEAAWTRYNEFLVMNFQYLLPVKIIESANRRKAEYDFGHVWWVDGRRKGPPVDPRQTGFNF